MTSTRQTPAGAAFPSAVDSALPGDGDLAGSQLPDGSLFDVLLPLARRWRAIVAVPSLLVVLATTYRFVHGSWYTSQVVFTPESGDFSLASNLGALASIAGRFGIGNVAGGGENSPAFYAKIIASRSILESVLKTPFPSGTAKTTRTLLEIIDAGGDSPGEQLEEGLRWMQNHVWTTLDDPTGIVVVHVTTQEPQLSADVANRIVALVNEFNLERRQSQSRQERKFTGERLAEAESHLRNAEAAHRRFLEANRVATSPLLTFEEARLRRDVDLRQEIFEALSRKFEEARISEVQDTPVITIVDAAVAPVKKSSPGLSVLLPLAVFLGLCVGVVLAYLQEYWSVAKVSHEADYATFSSAMRRMRAELKTPWRRAPS